MKISAHIEVTGLMCKIWCAYSSDGSYVLGLHNVVWYIAMFWKNTLPLFYPYGAFEDGNSTLLH